MKALIVKEDGLIYVNEVPEEPSKPGSWAHQEFFTEYYEDDLPAYNKALASAKENAVLCADQEQARELVMRKSSMGKDKDGFYQPTVGVHPIPDLKWEVKQKHIQVNHAYHPKFEVQDVAILTLSEQPKGEEGQEELTALDLKMFIEKELGGYKTVHIGHSYRVINRQFVYESDIMSLAEDLLRNFTITRNLKENQ